MGNGAAGDMDELDTCGIDTLNNSLEAMLRCDEDLEYDTMNGAILMRQERHNCGVDPLETHASTLRSLIDTINKSIKGGMHLPLINGRRISLHLDFDWCEGTDQAEPGCIILVKDMADGANHFMEFECEDEDGTVHARNCRAGKIMYVKVPSEKFETVLYSYILK